MSAEARARSRTRHINGVCVAEREAQLISARTKAVLAARKARGLKLSKPENLTAEARLAGAAHGFRTRQGGSWSAVQVKRVLDRKKQDAADPAA